MDQEVQILPINPGSDGDGRKWPKHHLERCDEYFKERIATDKWIHDLPGGPQRGVIYRLDKMPTGYAGFQKQRPDSKHVDRYIYGHPNGQFRSLNEFYPHFKHLMDFGGPAGCTCKLCMNGSSKAKPTTVKSIKAFKSSGSGNASDSNGDQPQHMAPANIISSFKQKAEPEHLRPQKRKLADVEGVPDVYESLIEQLKDAGPEESVDEPIVERMSPDWRVGNVRSKEHADKLVRLSRYVPRPGELVLFDASWRPGTHMAWDKERLTFGRFDSSSNSWLLHPEWKAGVVTQIPNGKVLDEDLITDEKKELAVNESGFRIEPLSAPGEERKSYSKQLKYVPLHAVRPFYLWQQCLNGLHESEWHPTIKHALTVSSSFCVVGRFRFRGTWPNATVFARGVYLGPELILVGDTVRLVPRKSEQRIANVTEVMVVTAIRLRFVNLDMEDEDMAPELPGLPYQTCLHFSGRVYTLDSAGSFDGVGKMPIDPESDFLPSGIAEYGQWYHYTDPDQKSTRTELPYTRILGRCVETTAMQAWFTNSEDKTPNAKRPIIQQNDRPNISHGLKGIIDARVLSQMNDKRIRSSEGRSWFWADTRVEQLDLHEVNQRDVGTKNKERTKGQMAKWKSALKTIDGKKGGADDYTKSKVQAQTQRSSYGMMRAAASSTEPEVERTSPSAAGSGQDAECDDADDAMDLDDAGDEPGSRGLRSSGSGSGDAGYETPPDVPPKRMEAITLSDSEDEEHLAKDQLVGELTKNLRPGGGGPGGRVIELG